MKLSIKARTLIKDAQLVYVSSASIWEMAIKIGLEKINLNLDEVLELLRPEGFTELPISMRHAAMVAKLQNHHRDPFDRILIAQALSEPLILVTADRAIQAYSELIELV